MRTKRVGECRFVVGLDLRGTILLKREVSVKTLQLSSPETVRLQVLKTWHSGVRAGQRILKSDAFSTDGVFIKTFSSTNKIQFSWGINRANRRASSLHLLVEPVRQSLASRQRTFLPARRSLTTADLMLCHLELHSGKSPPFNRSTSRAWTGSSQKEGRSKEMDV